MDDSNLRMVSNFTSKNYNKVNKMSEQKNDDLGKISLWLSDEGKTLASGKIQLFEQDGTITTLNVYIYENIQKKGDSSPDYFGFIKKPQVKGFAKPAGKKAFVKNEYRYSNPVTDGSGGSDDDDDDDTIAF